MDFTTFHALLLSCPKGLSLLEAFQSIYPPVLQTFFQLHFSLHNIEQFHDCLMPTPKQDIPLLVISRGAPSDWQSQHRLALQMSS